MTGEAFPFVNPWVAGCVFLSLALVFALGLLVPRRTAVVQVSPSDAKLDAIFVRFDEIETRLMACEHDTNNTRTIVKTLPSAALVGELSERVSAVSGQVQGMAAGLLGNTQSLGRIESFLMEAAADSIVSARGRGRPQKGTE